MIDINILKCILANTAAQVVTKMSAGVTCGLSLTALYTALNYVRIAESLNNGCDITPSTLDDILAFQNAKSLTFEICC